MSKPLLAAVALMVFVTASAPAQTPVATFDHNGLRWQFADLRRSPTDSVPDFFTAAERATACPAGWRLPTREEWMSLLGSTGGTANPRGGLMLPSSTLAPWDARYGLSLGGLRRGTTVVASGVMGLYWTSSDGAVPGNTEMRPIGIHLYATGETFQLEPTYAAAAGTNGFRIKCVQPLGGDG